MPGSSGTSAGLTIAFVSLMMSGLLICAPAGDRTTSAVTVTDSAGVRIVVNGRDDVALTATEVLRVGVIEGDPAYQFSGIRRLAVDSVGGVWVIDGNPSVRHYGPTGDFLGSIGARGEGPGEAPGEAPRGYYSIWLEEEEILVWAPPATIQRFAPDESGMLRHWWTIGRGTLGTPDFDTIITLAGRPMVEAGRDGALRALGSGSFFDGSPSLAAGPAGRIVYAHAFQYRIETYDPDGRLEEVVTRSVEPTPYSSEIEDAIEPAVRDGYAEISSGRAPAEDQVRRLTDQAIPDTRPSNVPLIETVFVSDDGSLWVERADRHPRLAHRAVAQAFGYTRTAWIPAWLAPSVFDLFTPEREYRGTVELPENFIPLDVTDDRVYGVATDELDVEYVVAYEAGSG